MPNAQAKNFTILCVASALIGAVLMLYAQTLSLAWDEGFHMLAAQLIKAGKKPYVDFLFAQAPLNAYWVAFMLRILPDGWHTVHALAALESAFAVLLAGDYILRRFPVPEWRLAGALATAVLMGLNVAVVEYGTLGQAYGLCLLLEVAAFRLAVVAVQKRSEVLSGLAGLAAGAAAASSLLTVTVTPILMIWIVVRTRRLPVAATFAGGVIVAFLPMLWLFVQAPQQVVFDVVKFHLFYRQVQWEGWQVHDLLVLTAPLDCTQAFLLGGFAIAGAFFLRKSSWPEDVVSEFYLAGTLALLSGLYLMTAHPTFPRYFLLMTPFAAIVAAAGFYACLMRLRIALQTRWPVALLIVLMAAALARSVHEDNSDNWYRIEPVAKKVDEVTAPGAMLLADEHVYFLTHRLPPPGLEWNGAHKVELPLVQANPLHLVPHSELVRRVQASQYSTVETCAEEGPQDLGLAKIYRQHAEVNDCYVYWDRFKQPTTSQ